jgi:dTDP-glucose 4,6-dehydratase
MLNTYPKMDIVGLTRQSNDKNMARMHDFISNPHFRIHWADIAKDPLADAFQDVDVVVNFAAKTFVDYSIRDPYPFIESNIIGTQRLLDEARRSKSTDLFFQISTDEVYGAILEGAYKEDARLNPSNPYAAAKAAADGLVISYHNTHGLRTIITRTENNYGSYQGREKVFPTFIRKALNNEPLPVFGDGKHRRMWLHVEDHCRAIDHLINYGKPGEIYHVAGEQELENIELAKIILKQIKGKDYIIATERDIVFIPDHDARPGHDRRYALNVEKLKATGWAPKWNIETGFKETIAWYLKNQWWFC